MTERLRRKQSPEGEMAGPTDGGASIEAPGSITDVAKALREVIKALRDVGQLRPRPTITASRWCSRRDGIIPLGVEFVAFDVEGGHLCVSDLDPLRIGPRIEFAMHAQTSCGRRCGDQLDHGQTAGQGRAAPSLRDMAEQPVLDLVPLRGSRWVVTDMKRQAGF